MAPRARARFAELLAIAAAFLIPAHSAGEAVPADEPLLATRGPFMSYGTADLAVASVADRVFVPMDSGVDFWWSEGRYVTTTGGVMSAGLTLPSGVRIEALEMEVCDVTATGEVQLWLVVCPKDSAFQGNCLNGAIVTSGILDIRGCDVFSHALPSPHVVDHEVNSYSLMFLNSTTDGSTRWRGARVYYRRQVSPAPAAATFADVPLGHPLHQFVEAVAASGITAGCGGGNFCPNDSVTRGQMAVFLAKALGLHWAP